MKDIVEVQADLINLNEESFKEKYDFTKDEVKAMLDFSYSNPDVENHHGKSFKIVEVD